jgi:hypothetical protein
MVDAGLRAAGDDTGTRLAILDGDLVGAAQVVVDIHSRFLFETALSAERERGAVGPDRMTELMGDAQIAAYGDGLDHDALHPYMWAVKGHYYTAFYNWPYTFGLLFGLGLYAEFRRDPERFRGGYDDLLGATGLSDAAPLAARFGIDIRDQGFWAPRPRASSSRLRPDRSRGQPSICVPASLLHQWGDQVRQNGTPLAGDELPAAEARPVIRSSGRAGTVASSGRGPAAVPARDRRRRRAGSGALHEPRGGLRSRCGG